MINEIVQIADDAQLSFDWDAVVSETKALVREDAELTSTIDDALIRRFEVRVKIGFNLKALQDDHSKTGYGDFTTVELPKLGIDRFFAHRCIRVAKLYEDSFVARTNLPHLPMNTWNQLASPTAPQSVIEQVISGDIKTPQAINEALQKAKEAEKQAREEAERANIRAQELFEMQAETQAESEVEINNLEVQIELLHHELEQISKPKEVTKEVDKPETIEHIKSLEAEINTLTSQRNNLSKLADELSADIDANEGQRERETRDLRVRQEWDRSTDAVYKSVNKFFGQMPMPLDTQIFEAEDWARLDQVIEVFQRGIATCRELRGGLLPLIIDAG